MIKHSEKSILIHYSEIALKKGNREFFEQSLKRNIQLALKDLPRQNLKQQFGRFLLTLSNDVEVDEIIERLKNVIGIANFSIAYAGANNINALKDQIYEKLAKLNFNTFRIKTQRSDKDYPLTSVQINRIVGERIHVGLNKAVDLTEPDLTCTIEIFNHKIFYHFNRLDGRKGLPIGSSGKVVSLLSSGIDSPVASYRMMTRGCKVILVHFHSFPFTDKSSYHNAITLATRLTRFQNTTYLYLLPLAQIQQAIIEKAAPKLRLLLYRRMMFRIAELIARKEKAKALVTGESVGQVASQTLENIAVISEVVSLPVLRPLIGMDKETIIEQAKEIGTFQTSIEPYDDCCSFLVPRNPETKATIPAVTFEESKIEDWQDLISEAIAAAELKKLEFP